MDFFPVVVDSVLPAPSRLLHPAILPYILIVTRITQITRIEGYWIAGVSSAERIDLPGSGSIGMQTSR